MHASVLDWVGRVVADNGLAERSTLEVGSQDVNGTVRRFFSGAYVGVDVAPGNGVDRVEDAEHLSDADGAYQVVISTEMLEHVDRPWQCVAELARVCQSGGHVIVTARGYDQRGCWEPHSWPNDTLRYSDRVLGVIANDAGLDVVEIATDPEGPGYFMHCTKP